MALEIRPFDATDWPAVWAVLAPAFRAGDSYPLYPDVDEAGARAYWLRPAGHVFVACDGDAVIGTFYIRPDQGGLGDHVCNCGYVVAEAARGRGLATMLCLESQKRARALGFLGMRFNLVVATNAPALRAWKKAGMEIVGRVHGAFRHKERGVVDAYVMYRWLGDDPADAV